MSIFDRWRRHRADLEIIYVGSPPISRGEFLILAAVEMMMSTLDDILAKVAEERTVEQSLATLLTGPGGLNDTVNALKNQVIELQKELAAAGVDTAKVDAILASLDDNESLLNGSIKAITNAVLQPGPDTTTDTSTGGDTGTDTVAGASGDDSVTGGQGADVVDPADLANKDALRAAITAAGGGDQPANATRADLEATLASLQSGSLTGGSGDDTVTSS